MHRTLAIAAALFMAVPGFAQVADDEPGFFDRLFQSDAAETDEKQGTFLERLIEDNLSDAGRTVEITGFQGALQGRATLDRLTIADDEGVWLTLSDAVLDWNRSALLRGRLEVEELAAAEILLPRLPAAQASDAPTPEATGFALPELPVSVNIGNVAAERIFIGAPVFGAETDVSLAGSVSLNGGDGATSIAVERLDGQGALTLKVAYANATRVLALDVSLNEDADGIFANLAGLPGHPSVDFEIKGEAPVTEFAADIRLATDGADRLAGRIATAQSEFDGALRFTADIGGDIAPVFAPDYQPFFGDAVQLSADVTKFPDGSVSLAGLSLTAQALSLTGTAKIAADGLPRNIGIQGVIASEDGTRVLLPLPGAETRVDRVDLEVAFDASQSDDWTARFQIAGLDRPGFRAEALTLDGTGQIATAGTARVSAAFDFDATRLDFGNADAEQALGEQVTGAARLTWAEGQDLSLESLRVVGESWRVVGAADMSFAESGPVIEGTADVRSDRLAAFSGLANRPLGGSAALDTRFAVAPLAGTFRVAAEGTGTDLSVGQPRADAILAGATRLDLTAARDETGISLDLRTLESPTAGISGKATLNTGGSSLTVQGDLTDAGLVAPGLSGPARFTVEGTEDEARDWDLKAGLLSRDLDLSADGRLSDLYRTPRFDGRVEAATGDLAAFSSLAGRPLGGRVNVAAEGGLTFDLSAFNLVADIEGGDVSVGQREADLLLAGDLAARVDASGSTGELLITALDLQTGALTAAASGRLSTGDSLVDLEARLADVAPFVAGFSGPVTVTGTVGRSGGGDLSVDLSADGPGGSQARATGTVAADFDSASLALNGTAPLGLANRFIAPRVISGTGGFDLRLDGPLALSSLSGRITTARARLVAPALGIALDEITLNATLGGGQADLSMTSAVQGGGRLTAEGPLTLSAPYAADLSIRLDNVTLSDPRLYETTVDGTITVDGPLAGGARIAGRLALGETDIRIPSSGFGGSGAIPEILHVREPPPVRGTRQRAGLLGSSGGNGGDSEGPVYPLDITIDAPNRIFIRGRGLESEFGGQLRLTGTTGNVVPLGAFELVRGRLDILGRRLQLDEARVTAQGSLEPYVNLRASTQAEEYRINVLVIGPASNPEITFSSEPELPQEEVLARLIFGRGLETLSPFQAAQLALAVRTLAGQGGEGVVGRIRGATGLADLDVVAGDDGSTAVRAGAYINDRLYTDVTVDSAGETELNLNLDLSPSITLKGGVTNAGDTSLGIFFERDY